MSYIMVLNDGETFTDLDGCAIYEVDDNADMDTSDIEWALEDGALPLVTRFGVK